MASIDLDLGSYDLSSTNSVAVADIKFNLAKAIKQTDLAKLDGSVIPIGKRKSITASIQGTIRGADYTALRTNIDALKAALEQTSEQKLTLDDERFLMVQYSAFSYGWKNFRTLATYNFSLLASDPFWLSETLYSVTQSPNSGTGFTVANSGNAATRAKVTITNGSGGTITDDIALENATTGERFEIEDALLNTKALVVNNRVDTQDISILNDGSQVIGWFGDVLTLAVGNNTIKLYSAACPNVSVKVEYHYAWV